MAYSSPDTNILIHHLVGGRDHQEEGADSYFEAVRDGDTDAVLLKEVDLEFESVVKKRVSELRTFASKAAEYSSWDKAEEYLPSHQYAENFASVLKENCSPEEAHSYLNRFKRNRSSSLKRLKLKMKIDDRRSFREEQIQKVEEELPDKGKDSTEEKETDAKIICSSFQFSYQNFENLVLISDDKHMTDADFDSIEEVMGYSEYNKYVSCNRPAQFVDSL